MTAPPRPDPASTDVDAGSWRRRALLVVLAVLLTALVQGVLVQSYYVSAEPSAPTLEPGDRVLVLRTDRTPEAGQTALVDDGTGGSRLATAPTGADVLGTVLWRFWPLPRTGPVRGGTTS